MARALFVWGALLGSLCHTRALVSNPEVRSATLPSREEDAHVIQQQLGYLPSNFVAVSARTQDQSPVAIQTYPLVLNTKSARKRRRDMIKNVPNEENSLNRQEIASQDNLGIMTPFPTLYWLTSPEISRAVAELERQGWVGRLEVRLKNDEALQDFLDSHQAYALSRWQSLLEQDQTQLREERTHNPSVERMYQMIRYSGVAGTDYLSFSNQQESTVPPSIKCLHGHYAHYRSTCTSAANDKHHHSTLNPVGRWVHQLLMEEFPDLAL